MAGAGRPARPSRAGALLELALEPRAPCGAAGGPRWRRLRVRVRVRVRRLPPIRPGAAPDRRAGRGAPGGARHPAPGQPREQVRATGLALAGFVDTRAAPTAPRGLGGASIPWGRAGGAPGDAGADRGHGPRRLPWRRHGTGPPGSPTCCSSPWATASERPLILDGDLYRGASGVVGEIGHIVVREGAPAAPVATWAACRPWPPARPSWARCAPPWGRAWSAPWPGPCAGGRRWCGAAGAGDRLASSVLRQAGQDVGRALARGPTCWAPRWWSWGGHAPALGDLFVDEVRRVLGHHVVPPIAERMRVGVGILGAQAPALGAPGAPSTCWWRPGPWCNGGAGGARGRLHPLCLSQRDRLRHVTHPGPVEG